MKPNWSAAPATATWLRFVNSSQLTPSRSGGVNGLSAATTTKPSTCQETLVEAWRSLARLDESLRFSTWLYGILCQRFLKARRKSRPVASEEDQPADRPGRETPPTVAAEQVEESRLVQAAVAALPDEHRMVVELRFCAGLSLHEIATLLGWLLGTVKSRLHYALEKLRLAKCGVDLFAAAGESPVHTPRA